MNTSRPRFGVFHDRRVFYHWTRAISPRNLAASIFHAKSPEQPGRSQGWSAPLVDRQSNASTGRAKPSWSSGSFHLTDPKHFIRAISGNQSIQSEGRSRLSFCDEFAQAENLPSGPFSKRWPVGGHPDGDDEANVATLKSFELLWSVAPLFGHTQRPPSREVSLDVPDATLSSSNRSVWLRRYRHRSNCRGRKRTEVPSSCSLVFLQKEVRSPDRGTSGYGAKRHDSRAEPSNCETRFGLAPSPKGGMADVLACEAETREIGFSRHIWHPESLDVPLCFKAVNLHV